MLSRYGRSHSFDWMRKFALSETLSSPRDCNTPSISGIKSLSNILSNQNYSYKYVKSLAIFGWFSTFPSLSGPMGTLSTLIVYQNAVRFICRFGSHTVRFTCHDRVERKAYSVNFRNGSLPVHPLCLFSYLLVDASGYPLGTGSHFWVVFNRVRSAWFTLNRPD